jgi:hypothetical protein
MTGSHESDRPLFRREELVHQDGAVVADDLTKDAAVVVLVTDAAAAAGVVELIGDQTLFIPILVGCPSLPSSRGCRQ